MNLSRCLAALALAFTICSSAAMGQEELVIFDGRNALDSLRAQGVEVTQVATGGIALRNGRLDNRPGVPFTGLWSLGNVDRLELAVRSTSAEPITLYCRLDCRESDVSTMDGIITREIKLAPGERAVWKVELPNYLNWETRPKLFAMRGKPGGIKNNE